MNLKIVIEEDTEDGDFIVPISSINEQEAFTDIINKIPVHERYILNSYEYLEILTPLCPKPSVENW